MCFCFLYLVASGVVYLYWLLICWLFLFVRFGFSVVVCVLFLDCSVCFALFWAFWCLLDCILLILFWVLGLIFCVVLFWWVCMHNSVGIILIYV